MQILSQVKWGWPVKVHGCSIPIQWIGGVWVGQQLKYMISMLLKHGHALQIYFDCFLAVFFLAAMGTIYITINLWCLTSLARDWSDNEDTHCIHTCTKYTHTCPEFIQYLWQERLKDIWEVIESGPRLVDHVKAHCPRHLVNIWVVHLNIEQNIRSMLDASLSAFQCQIAGCTFIRKNSWISFPHKWKTFCQIRILPTGFCIRFMKKHFWRESLWQLLAHCPIKLAL